MVFVKHGSQSIGSCPFCGKDKFFANPTNGLWDCKTCIISGNFEAFLERRSKQYQQAFKGSDVVLPLCNNRGLKPQTLKLWGVGWDSEHNVYTIPMNGNTKRTTKDIHRYVLGKKSYSTSGGQLQLIAPLEIKNTKQVWVTEGEWDGMALYECLNGSEDVYASPGAGTFPKNLAGVLDGKDVVIVFDNDTAGRKGAGRTGALLSGVASSIQYLIWPVNEELKEGHDVRDLYVTLGSEATLNYIQSHLSKNPPTEDGSVPAAAAEAITPTGEPVDREKIISAYREWLHLKNPEMLDVMFGSVFANRLNIDPLWMFLVGAPGSCKTELLMSLSDAPMIVTTTSVTPPALISGANFSGGDPSLIPKLDGKVLIIKDFTTILNMNITARDEIFGILRDAYDGKIEKHFGNGIHRTYKSRFGIIAGVTPAIDSFAASSSVLGERFLKYRVKQIGKVTIGEEAITQAIKNLTHESKMREALRAIAKEVMSRLLSTEHIPTLPHHIEQKILCLAQWVAVLRGVVSREKYTQTVSHKPVAEVGTRLAKQLCALAMGIAVYRQEHEVSEESFRVAAQVAKDTAPDIQEEIVKQLYIRQDRIGYTGSELANWTHIPGTTLTNVLQNMEMLHVLRKQDKGYRLNHSIVTLIEKADIYTKEMEYARRLNPVRTVHKVGV